VPAHAAPRGKPLPTRTLTPRDQEKTMEDNRKDRDEKNRALELAIGQIERQHGKGAIMRLGADQRIRVEAISTGALNLDAAIGVGGIPRGRVTEVFGPESSGKTTIALQVVANAQKNGGIAAFIDAEHALDAEYARKLGVQVDNLLVSQPDTGEQALEIAEVLVRSNAVDVVVVDSVAALVPKAEIEGEMGDTHVGLQARLMSQALRKLTAAIARSNTAVIFINQIREKIGVMFGPNETTPGGRALKFYASLRLDIRRIGAIKEGDEATGNRVRVKVVKNKVAPPFKQAEFDIMYGDGISREGLLIDLGVEQRIVDKSGAWFSYAEDRLGQGRENTRTFLKENPDIADAIERDLRKALGIVKEPLPADELGGNGGRPGTESPTGGPSGRPVATQSPAAAGTAAGGPRSIPATGRGDSHRTAPARR
jgi:recombination protein RecA